MNTLKKSRAASFALVALVYILATLVGIFTFRALTLTVWAALLIADVAATLFTFLFSLLFQNASVYDPYWSVAPPVILIGLAVGRPLNLFGGLLLTVVSLWAIRLTANWAYTFHGLMHEDWRYVMLREKTGAFYPLINLLGIHLVPTLVVYGCVLPAVTALRLGLSLTAGSAVFLLLSTLAVLLQCVADVEMHAYRRHRATPFIRTGVWKYARHPNYLAEILMWWGVALSVISAMPSLWYLAAGAFANTLLFLFVSIPMADGRQSRKAGFAEYKSQTHALLPIPKRK